ncbi:MAG: zinc-binding dehydrogenase [candidate division Zixibacteria bacterium]|nr:zinc-binding dehydrogenase [candidate division Zixibacteria bacterium]
MKAVVYKKYGSPDVIQVEDIEKPVPSDNEVLIKVHASTVTAVDCVFRKGKPFISRLANGISKPKHTTLGTEFSGVIETAGKAVKRLNEGGHVYGTTAGYGANAQYICLPEDKATISLKPSNLSHEEAACCDGGLTALPFLRDKGKIKAGQKILIIGASGSVGSAAVQLAVYFGAEVTGVCSSSNVDMVESLGADEVIDYTKEDFTANGKAYDIIFDAVGKSSFSRCKNSLKSKGIYLVTDLSPAILPQMLLTSMLGGKKAVIEFTGLRPPEKRTEDLVFLKGLYESGKMKSVIDRSYPLKQIAEAHAYVEKGHKKGNVVININDNR